MIGDEILDGFVRDSNAAWLARRLHRLGIPLDRISVVPDDEAAIAEALAAELARARPRVVFTSGGIGTTPDDRTMSAVARFLDVDLVEEPALRHLVDGIVSRLQNGDGGSDAQRSALSKLALVPRGARSITMPSGGAPSARIDIDGGLQSAGGVVLIVLPGVPGQFRDLVTHLESTMLEDLGSAVHVAELRHPYPESVLTPLLEDLERRRPDVRIGSYPGSQCLLRIQGDHQAVRDVVSELEAAIATMSDDPHMRQLAERWRQGWTAAAERWSSDDSPQ